MPYLLSVAFFQIKPMEVYMEWIEQFRQHRLYRQHILSFKEITTQNTEEISSMPTAESQQDRRNSISQELSLIGKDLFNLEGLLSSIPMPKKDDDSKLKDFVVLGKEGSSDTKPHVN